MHSVHRVEFHLGQFLCSQVISAPLTLARECINTYGGCNRLLPLKPIHFSDFLVLIRVNDKAPSFWSGGIQASFELWILMFQVATWEKQIYTCCRDGLVRRYQLSDLWPLEKRSPTQWKGSTLINHEQKHHQSFPRSWSLSVLSTSWKSQHVSYIDPCGTVIPRPPLNWVKSSHVLTVSAWASPCVNSPHNTGQGSGLWVYSHANCVIRSRDLFSGGNKKYVFGEVWVWKTLLNFLTPSKFCEDFGISSLQSLLAWEGLQR
jgi:hypothetical protein